MYSQDIGIEFDWGKMYIAYMEKWEKRETME